MARKLSKRAIEDLLNDHRNEPSWRSRANIHADYYDGNQLTSDIMVAMEERGLATLVRNYIRPTIDLVLGMEARNRRDWKVTPDLEEYDDIALAQSAQLKIFERQTGSDFAISEAYANQIKVGVGWVEVGRERDPFRGPYRCRNVHRREIFWDWRDTDYYLDDARYLVRRKWYDIDNLAVNFKKHAKLIKQVGARWADWDETSQFESGDTGLMASWDEQRSTTLEEAEWLEPDRDRALLYEIWYRVWDEALVMKLQNGLVLEYDRKNPVHQALLAADMGEVMMAPFPRMRLTWWIGPHQLADIPTPYPHQKFPYVPFWAFREDRTGIPYGFIRGMVSPQDEINARLSKLMWHLSSKFIIADSDAVDMPWNQVREEASRPNAMIRMNPNRKNKDQHAFRMESDFGLAAQQFEVLKDATETIQATAGIYQSMLGQAQKGLESGVAINNLVEQGSTTLAEVNDNFRMSHMRVGELALTLINEDTANNPTDVRVEQMGRKRTVSLNRRIITPEGIPTIQNSLMFARTKVALTDHPETPSHKAWRFQTMVEFVKSMPAELQPFFADFMVKLSELPERDELVKRIQDQLGIGKRPEEMTPEELQQQQIQQQKQEESEALALEQQRAEVDEIKAKIEKLLAEVNKISAEADLMDQEQIQKEDTHAVEMNRPDIDGALKVQEHRQKMRIAEEDHIQRQGIQNAELFGRESRTQAEFEAKQRREEVAAQQQQRQQAEAAKLQLQLQKQQSQAQTQRLRSAAAFQRAERRT